MLKLRYLAALCVIVGCAALTPAASAEPNAEPVCSSPGTELTGNVGNLTVTGNAYVPNDGSLTVHGNLTIAPGACLDAFSTGTVVVRGNVLVGKDAVLGLGCSEGAIGPFPPCEETTTDDYVGGNIIGNQPLTMYLTAITINGNLISNGGGPGATFHPYTNFPIKENKIGGNLIVQGWEGTWFGALRNKVRGNAIIQDNVGVAIGEFGPDSTEIATNTIGGNLICFRNSPAAQLGDSGGLLNTVGGKKIGQCTAV